MKWELFLATWCVGLPGIIAMEWVVLPALVKRRRLQAPLWVLRLVSGFQTAVLMALAAAVGAELSSSVDLKAPMLAAFVHTGSLYEAIHPQLGPGVIGGVLGAVLLYVVEQHGPRELRHAASPYGPALISRVLYGGISEEILLRWGLMTLFVWVLWYFVQGGHGAPSTTILWSGVVASALAFGAGHLPAARALLGRLRIWLTVWVVGANAAFGLVAGYLYWHYGLESAMVAHALAHTLIFILGQRSENP